MTEDRIPQILRDIPPEKFRELIETLMGAPLETQNFGSRREVIENPTDEQKQEPHNALAGDKIMTRRRREHLRFGTDWLPQEKVTGFAFSTAQITYLGAMAESRFRMKDSSEVACSDRWTEMLESESPGSDWRWPSWVRSLSTAASETGVKAVVKAIIEKMVD